MSELLGSNDVIEKNGNLSTIRMPRGKINLVLGAHEVESQIPVDVMEDSDIFVLEWAADHVRNPVDAFRLAADDVIWGPIIEVAKQKRKPIIFPDVTYDPLLADYESKRVEQLRTVELNGSLVVLAMLFGSEANAVRHNRVQLRRTVLKSLGAAVVGIWGGLPMLSNMMLKHSAVSGEGMPIATALAKSSDLMHPELQYRLIFLRNKIIAYKLIILMDLFHKRLGKDNNFMLSIGAAHFAIEDIFAAYSKGELTLEQLRDELFADLQDVVDEGRAIDPTYANSTVVTHVGNDVWNFEMMTNLDVTTRFPETTLR